MALYSVQDHEFLTPKAQALISGKFDGYQLLAESLLGLSALPVITASPYVERVRLAIVIQINFEVEQGIDPFYLHSVSSSHTSQSAVYRDNVLSPQAEAVLSDVLILIGQPRRGYNFSASMVSHRGPNSR